MASVNTWQMILGPNATQKMVDQMNAKDLIEKIKAGEQAPITVHIDTLGTVTTSGTTPAGVKDLQKMANLKLDLGPMYAIPVIPGEEIRTYQQVISALSRAIPPEWVKEQKERNPQREKWQADAWVVQYNDDPQTTLDDIVQWYERAILLIGHPEN